MNEQMPIRDRWIVESDPGTPAARAGALFRQALQREPLEADRLLAIRERLRGSTQSPRSHSARRLAIALGLLLSGGALTATADRLLDLPGRRPLVRPAAPDRTPSARPRAAARSGEVARPPALAPEGVVVSQLDDPPIPLPTAGSERRRSPRGVEPSASRPSSDVTPPALSSAGWGPSALAQESSLVASALHKLRQDGDGRGALAILDEHDLRFSDGELAPEAALARIEALIQLRRNADALGLLDRMALPPLGTGRGLLIARAELRAAASRCASALPDFDLLLAGGPILDSITERALWGRASCRAGSTDTPGARADLQDYLARFPSGRFASEARAALRE